jgi:hypothetical protein
MLGVNEGKAGGRARTGSGWSRTRDVLQRTVTLLRDHCCDEPCKYLDVTHLLHHAELKLKGKKKFRII